MPSKEDSLLKHMGWPHVLRDLGFLNQYCEFHLNSLDNKKYHTVATRCHIGISKAFKTLNDFYLISVG